MSLSRSRQHRRRRTVAAVTLAMILGAAFAAGLALAFGTTTTPHIDVKVNVGRGVTTKPLAPGFVGFSIEYTSAFNYGGASSSAPNRPFLQLVRNLNPGQSPVLRFGGDTTDWTWWPVAGERQPAGIRYALTPRWASVVGAMARTLNARLIMGINFEADSRTLAGTESRQLLDRIGEPYLSGFELGNEPEVYGAIDWYLNTARHPVYGRPHDYGVPQYLPDWAAISAALPASVPRVAPATGGPKFIAATAQILRAQPATKLASFHRYPLRRCAVARSSPMAATIPHLLSPSSSTGLAQSLAPAVAAAGQRGVPARVDELNSVSCGGQLGVSDRFDSALWGLDTLFAMDQVGVSGVNFHTFRHAFYEPFGFSQTHGRWQAQVKPLYYGMLMFTRAAPPGSRLLPVGTVKGRSTLHSWATRGSDGTVRVVLINESTKHAVTAGVRAPTRAGSASLIRLSARSLSARAGITLGGQSFSAETPTGDLSGTPHAVSVSSADDRFAVRLPPASAALLTLR